MKEIEITDESQFITIRNEMGAMACLDYQSIIDIYGYSRIKRGDKDYFILVMQKADTTLESVIGNPLDESSAKECPMKDKCLYIIQIAHGIWCMNLKGYNHGDLKLDNILMVDGDCKIADFGLANYVPDRI